MARTGVGLQAGPAPRRAAMTAEAALEAYLSAAPLLPKAAHPSAPRQVASLAEAAEGFDAVLLDAYGVLNVGARAIPGAPEAVAALREAGRRVMVVSNSAAYPKATMLQRFRRMGFDFRAEEVTTSREALLEALAERPARNWAAMIGEDRTEFEGVAPLRDDLAIYDEAEGILLVGSDGWSEERQRHLECALRARSRPVLVGNPDIVAPREGGLSFEPGHYAHRLAAAGLAEPEFFGKPFADVFRLALRRLGEAPGRVLMVGDTLHTDVLGGAAMGFATALVTGHGTLRADQLGTAMKRSGIVPDLVLETP